MSNLKAIKSTILILLVVKLSAQSLPILHPKLSDSRVFTKAEHAVWKKTYDQYKKLQSGAIQYEKLSKADKKMIDSFEGGFGPITHSGDCSWYCGAELYKIKASSHLLSDGNNTYVADNIHDFDLFTAWVPDSSKGGIGSKINFYFKPLSPRVNEIIVWNGYQKNIDLWNSNSRVAKFKLSINGKPTAILQLKDVTQAQSFKIKPIRSNIKNKDLVITLEILDVYKGTKYNDVVVSEINFSGLDVHCFAKGTQITMVDNNFKNIENIKKGDWVLTYDNSKKKLVKTKVKKLVQTVHAQLIKLKFSDREIIVTDDHPFWTNENKWASINSFKSNTNYLQNSKIVQLKIRDKVFVASENKYIDLLSFEVIDTEQITYTLELENGDSFIANGVLVKTENVVED